MSTNDKIAEFVHFGKTIRASRKSKRMTLEELARESGVSKSVLSQVERGATNPTLSTLWNIATALSMDPAELFEGDKGVRSKRGGGADLISIAQNPVIENSTCKYHLVILNEPQFAGVTELYHLTLKPGGNLKSNPHARGAREQVTILKGSVEVVCGGEKMRVLTGQTVRYAADVSHSISTIGKKTSEVLLFVTFV